MSKKLKDSFPSNDNRASSNAVKNGIWDETVESHLKNSSLNHLPQAKVLTSCVNHLITNEDIQEAYLRGSFSAGVADKYSDIDLFLVVKPENLERTYKAFHDFMKKTTPIVFGCHDRLAADYGGVGFEFLCQGKDGNLFQFDLYTAMKGTPPKILLFDAPRVFSRDKNYCWLDEKNQKQQLPDDTSNFITKHTEGLGHKEKMELLYKDLAVTLFVMSKHLKRGQVMRSLDMNNHALGVCVEMIEEIKGIDTYQSPLYAADAIIRKYEKDPDKRLRDALKTLKGCSMEVPSIAKAEKIFGIGRGLLEIACPDVHSRLEPAMNIFKQRAFAPAQSDQKFTKPLIVRRP